MVESLLQPTHLVVLACLIVLFFGGKWFANLGKGFAEAMRNFKRSSNPSQKAALRNLGS